MGMNPLMSIDCTERGRGLDWLSRTGPAGDDDVIEGDTKSRPKRHAAVQRVSQTSEQSPLPRTALLAPSPENAPARRSELLSMAAVAVTSASIAVALTWMTLT